MPMDYCHISLGRPQQYDRNVVYDRRLNQYTIWTNGVKDTLMPLIEAPDEMNCTTVKLCLVNGKQFEKELRKSQVCFSIIPWGLSCASNGRPSEDSDGWVSKGNRDYLIAKAASVSWVPVEII